MMGNALSKIELDYGAMELEAEIYSNRGVGRQYRAHDDPEIDAGSRFMMLLRLQFVQKLLPLTEDNRDYLFHLSKDPKRARSVHKRFAYGWTQVGTTLWEQFRRHGIWDAEDEEKSAAFKSADFQKKSPSKNAEATPCVAEADSGVSGGGPGPVPAGGKGAGSVAVVGRPQELWGLLNTPAEDDTSASSTTLSDQPHKVGDDPNDLFKSI